jgi:branched-subunit amino acid ABC-type transport system permease component
LELLHASRAATFGVLGLALLAAGLSSMLGRLTFAITFKGTTYNHLLELGPAWNLALLATGLSSVLIVVRSLSKMERAQDRIIELKLRSDEEADSILKYQCEDYRHESHMRFALGPMLMVVALIISGIALDLWLNRVFLRPWASIALLCCGVSVGCISILDQLLLSRRQAEPRGAS